MIDSRVLAIGAGRDEHGAVILHRLDAGVGVRMHYSPGMVPVLASEVMRLLGVTRCRELLQQMERGAVA